MGWIGEGRGAQICGYGLVVEPQPSKLMARVRLPLPAPEKIEVNGTLLTREIGKKSAHIAQSVEHFLGKEEVIGSNPIVSTRLDGIIVAISFFGQRYFRWIYPETVGKGL